jgi:SAM-dependent methyltransferase
MISPLRGGVARLVFDRLSLRRAPRLWPMIEQALRGRHGIEIAGPSPPFEAGGRMPVYAIVGSLENYGFHASDGMFEFSGRAGPSRVCDASALPRSDASCDFVLSSHVLEHIANPLRALREWHRVLRLGGHLFMLLPHGARTFDRRRAVTEWSHLMADFERQTPEADCTHIQETVRLTDTRHWSFNAPPEWRDECEKNADTRNVHHHVFDLALAKQAATFAGFRVLAAEYAFPFHIALFAAK